MISGQFTAVYYSGGVRADAQQCEQLKPLMVSFMSRPSHIIIGVGSHGQQREQATHADVRRDMCVLVTMRIAAKAVPHHLVPCRHMHCVH